MILNDNEIKSICEQKEMINPFVSESKKENLMVYQESGETKSYKTMSYGLSSFGYDVILSDDVFIFSNANAGIIDPKNLDKQSTLVKPVVYCDDSGKYVILPPTSYLLGVTKEYFNIPNDILVICVGKSTYARSGVIVNVTPIEPGFKGNVVIEVSNATTLPVKVYLHEGIAQFIFFKGNPCMVSYNDRNGKYQGQTGVTLPKV